MKSVFGEDVLNTYSMPAPWGSIVLTEALGELWQVCVSNEPPLTDSRAPAVIAHWMETLERILKTSDPISDEDFELLTTYRRFQELSPLAKDVFQTLREIPKGRWMTYREVARTVRTNSYARAVARCLSTNPFPILLPCHRIVTVEELRRFKSQIPSTFVPKFYLGESEWSKIGGWLRLNDLLNAS